MEPSKTREKRGGGFLSTYPPPPFHELVMSSLLSACPSRYDAAMLRAA
jgi:hypothetical protein